MRYHFVLPVLLLILAQCTDSNQDRHQDSRYQDRYMDVALEHQAIIINFGTRDEQNAFHRTNWHRSRDSLTISGIQVPEFSLEKTIPEADWHMFLWMETGYEDSVTTRFTINGQIVNPDFMPFTPSAEQSPLPQRTIRLMQYPFSTSDGEFSLKISGVQDTVRLLALMLIPDGAQPATPEQQQILDQIRDLGHFQETASLEPLLENLQRMSGTDRDRNFALHWSVQLDWFTTGERYFHYRGWERLRPLTSLSLFEHLHQSVIYMDGILNYPGAETHPLYERALWLRGRTLWWLDLERGDIHEKLYATKDLRRMLELQPADSLVRMYNDEKIRTPSRANSLERPAGAPDWSWKQHEILVRLDEIAGYWVSIQDSLGEMGGKLGDDVEILRWWPILVTSGNKTAMQGWKALADGVWNSRHIHLGYARNISDVEHASEFIADTAPNMILFTDDPEYIRRLSYSAAHFDTLWSDINPFGRRHFRSTWFSSTELDLEEPKNRDVPFNARATKAVRYYAWKTGDQRTIDILNEWSMAWVHAALRTDKGKPQGIIPPSVRFHDEAINGNDADWHIANMYWNYYDWGGGEAMIDQQVFLWSITDNDSLLIPLKMNLDLVRNYHGSEALQDAEEGSEAWAAGVLTNNANFWNIAGEWRLQSGNDEYDDIILEYGSPYTRFRITGDVSHLNTSFEQILGIIRYNLPLLTTDAIHTDRIYISPLGSGADDQIKAMITGDQSPENSSPYTAVTWEDTNNNLTVLIRDHGPEGLNADVFSYYTEPVTVIMKAWQLRNGTYTLTNGGESTNIIITSRGQALPITIEPRVPVNISIRRNRESN